MKTPFPHRRTLPLALAIVLSIATLSTGCSKTTDAATGETATLTVDVTVSPTPTPTPTFSPDPHLNPSQTLIGLVIANTDGLLTRMAEHGFLRTAENLGYPAKLYEADSSTAAATLVDQAIADGCRGLLIWADSPATQSAIGKAKSAGLEVVVPYYPTDDADADANLVPDPNDFAPEAARILCARLESQSKTSGLIVITGAEQEPAIADAFANKIASDYPQYTVTRFPGEPTAESIMAFVREHGDLAGVLALDPTSGKLWTKACESVQSELRAVIKAKPTPSKTPKPDAPTPTPDTSYRRSAVVLVLDVTEAHLAWVRDGLVYGVIARPYYDSTAKSTAVLDRLMRGLPTQTEVRIDAPILRKNGVGKYIGIALEVKEWFGE